MSHSDVFILCQILYGLPLNVLIDDIVNKTNLGVRLRHDLVFDGMTTVLRRGMVY